MTKAADALSETAADRKADEKRESESSAKKQNAKFRRSSCVGEASTVDATVINVDAVTSESFAVRRKRSSVRATKEGADKPVDFAKDWKRIAEICDRLFFYLFLLAFVITTLVLFHPLTIPVRHSLLTVGPQL